MKRTALTRKTGLARPAAALGRSELARKGSGGANPPRPSDGVSEAPGPLTALEWRREVWRLDGGRCRVCRVEVPRDADRWTWQAHHPTAKDELPPSRKWDPDNGIVLCRRHHERHESATERVPFNRLPDRAVRFAAREGDAALYMLERLHPKDPAAGNGGGATRMGGTA